MPIISFTAKGYRSIQDLNLELHQINVIVGANGCGKSNLYNSLSLLSKAASGHLAQTLALEGGMHSVLWAGERKHLTRTKKPVRLTLGVQTELYSYELSLGLPVNELSFFSLDPEVKEEYVWYGPKRRLGTTFLERKSGITWITNKQGERIIYRTPLTSNESVFSQLQEPHLYPELSSLREIMRKWRFYHHFRTDINSPIRLPQIGIFTPILSNEGTDLAAALRTIYEIGDAQALHQAIDEAFPGCQLIIKAERGRFEVLLNQPGIQRPFEAKELSDGTLRYLCLIAALLSPRPPEFLALNEPEASLHPDLIKPLAHLISKAGGTSQILITTHSNLLAQYLAVLSKQKTIVLEKNSGCTEIVAH